MKLPLFHRSPGWFPRLTTTAAALLFALTLQAHPGHGLLDGGAAHLWASPYHLAAITLTGICVLAGAQFIHRRVPRHALRTAGWLMLAAALTLWNLGV
jgi:hypothetical protein